MGSSSSKFRKHLQNGDEYAALQLYQNSSDLRKGLDPNSSYGDNYNHDTPLHYASRHAMKYLLRVFLHDLSGNPNKKNSRNEGAMHCLCIVPENVVNVLEQRRTECMTLILQWRGATLQDGEIERVDISTQDEKMNTVLHYAASSGLKRCVELLVNHGAPLFAENLEKQTPCDTAEKYGHGDIALYLESKMVFSNVVETTEISSLVGEAEVEEAYSGLRAQDLQEAKDQLLVETSDMLRVPLFTAEALLRNYEWSREMLLEAWMEDAKTCCEKCGVMPPSSITDNPTTKRNVVNSGATIHTLQATVEHELGTPVHKTPPLVPLEDEDICDICACPVSSEEEPVPMSCDHQFCRHCWKMYLTGKIKEGDAHNITCPGFACNKLVPVEIIETLVSRDIALRYLQFDIKAFVDSNPSIKWCPFPGCGHAVKLPDSENPLSPTFRGTADAGSVDFSHAVDCGNGHMFCWECLGEAHEPASCENWKKWHQKVSEIKPEELSGTEDETEMSANCLWLITNSKPCPNCKSPIQKNEGCNHMKCSKCKHDFCWVCLEPWKKHSSATGGYFRCNRYEVLKKVEQGQDELKAEAEARNKRLQELNRFVHYYTRFKNHENSYKLEVPLISTAKEKMLVLAKAVNDSDTANTETKFVEDAVHQLLKARRVLKCSYVYGFYLQDTGYKKPIFEFMQTELEECSETLSEMVARPYLRTPRNKIIQTAHIVQRKRHEFVTAIAKGLVPPDNSPNSRRKKNKYSIELDDDLKKALLASLQDLDPENPWVKDPSGRHTNVSALLDWPEDSDDSDTEITPPNTASSQPSATEDPSGEEPQAEKPPVEVCARAACNRPCAQNPRTGDIHNHCSMKCMRMERIEKNRKDDKPPEPLQPEEICDYQVDLLRALEMSRMHFRKEMDQLLPGSGDRSPHSPVLFEHAEQPPRRRTPEPEMSQQPLVLSDPPRGRGRDSPHKLNRLSLPSSTHPLCGTLQLDDDLQRALELSRQSAQDEECDLRMAIELSLKESKSQPSTPAPYHMPFDLAGMPPTPHTAPHTQSSHGDLGRPFNAEYSTIVNRVPNRSIEDLVSDGAAEEKSLADAESLARRTTHRHIRRRSNDLQDSNEQKHSSNNQTNSFGVIKDISVNNILTGDHNKTKEFEQKDFSQAFAKFYSSGNGSMSGSRTEAGLPLPHAPLLTAGFSSGGIRAAGVSHLPQNPTVFGNPWTRNQSEMPGTDPHSQILDSNTTAGEFVAPRKNRKKKLTSEHQDRDEGLKTALQNLASLSNTLPGSRSTGDDEDDDPDSDLIVDSQMLESLLQGAEKYGGIDDLEENYDDLEMEKMVLMDQQAASDMLADFDEPPPSDDRPDTSHNRNKRGSDDKGAVFV